KIVVTAPPLRQGRLRQDRTYLVTGGLGGIGCAVAEWLADRGAATIVLNGRREPDPAAEEAIRTLRERGVTVEVELADVSDPGAVDRMLARMDRELPPLGGVIHSVGVLSDAALTNQSWESFETVLRPKILGAWHLHRATLDRDLDLFILFSSRVGVMGNPGQANHAAANAFLDQLAGHRRALGLAGQAIAWGAWSEIGEAAEQRGRIERQRAALGGRWFTPEQGIRALDRLVRQDATHSVVMAMDWSVFEEAVQDRPPLVEDLLSSASEPEDEASSSSEDVLTRLRGPLGTERRDLLVTFLQGEVQAVLRLSSAPSPTVGFFDLGMDSLMAVEFRNRLNRAFSGVYTAPNTVVFDYPDIAKLAAHLDEELGEVGEAPAPEPESTSTPFAVSVPAPVTEAPQEAPADEDGIAIVGMACRFPGAPDLDAFWRQLEAGVEAVSDGRPDGGSWTGVAGDPAGADDGTRRGGFIEGIDRFDARFFGITPIGAWTMDPQHRLLLETSWRALEDAGVDPDAVRDSNTGVYAGVASSEYRDLMLDAGENVSYLGTAASMAVGTVSFRLGLTGPAMAVELNCASALVAVHHAVMALRQGEVDMALAGGVNAILSPGKTTEMVALGMLSPTGRCRAFDAAADGFPRGEGCGMVLLKRLSDAEADGDRIWGVIRGSAVNQSGASAGPTVPNGVAQQAVMEAALARAGVAPADVDYLEAHGNGSVMGDPIEMQAAATVYGKGRAPDRPLLMGSVKTNVGHLETAAGVAALIKAALAVNRGVIPPHLHFENPTPVVDWNRLPVRVTSETTPWPAHPGRPARAAVSAFGVSGANAHAVVEGYGTPDGIPAGRGVPVAFSKAGASGELLAATDTPAARGTRLLPLSAKSDAALGALARTFLDWLDDRTGQLSSGDAGGPLLSDLAWTAGVGRSHFAYRAGVVFRDAESLREGLTSLAEPDGVLETEPAPPTPRKIVFACAEEAGPWIRATEPLYASEPVFRAVLEQCDEWIREERGASLLEPMFGGDGSPSLESPEWSGPALYAVQCGLTALWSSIGIGPQAANGQGAGALAAAQATGALDLEDGLRLAVLGEAPPGAGSANSELLDGGEIVIEIGPGPAGGFIAAVAEAYEAGLDINFAGLFTGETRRRISLPGYPFERRRYWIPEPRSRVMKSG
ncbi:MAG: SDR family NAD(P)-dependent oxidoreductase, partial [Acidobacteriota bacterium]|nr:SDR family NAD(P)-dependent oxidoreductase [Acidobacteriota bacterium]